MANTTITLVSYVLLVSVDIHYSLAGALSWTLGVLHGYIWNRRWTFEAAEHRAFLLVQYLAVYGVGLALNGALLALLVAVAGVSHIVAELVAVPATVATTYVGMRHWVFAEHLKTVGPRPKA